MAISGAAVWASLAFFGAIGLLTALLGWISIRDDAHSPQALTEDGDGEDSPS